VVGAFAFGTFAVEDTVADTDQSTGVWLAEPELFRRANAHAETGREVR
jgi:hypothetical protein